jgi:hypothetical protein
VILLNSVISKNHFYMSSERIELIITLSPHHLGGRIPETLERAVSMKAFPFSNTDEGANHAILSLQDQLLVAGYKMQFGTADTGQAIIDIPGFKIPVHEYEGPLVAYLEITRESPNQYESYR